jgi:predicted unusual protein kinase regulating ubiquinone biosynthesis (AarF/ABC1/UbiB family)
LEAARRLGQFLFNSGVFITSVVLDKKFEREEEMVEQRSQELLELITKLGPTFIKVGQALSARTDLLPAAYAAGLTGLQDAVPPFSGELGRAIIEQELGIRIDDVFSEFSLEPVASASVGQVYRGTLRETRQEVAVKVQRPKVLYNVALDLFMMRSIAPTWKQLLDANTDFVGLIDAWGSGFVDELDYRKEAAATTAFSEAMRQRGLGSVFAPEVVSNLSSVHVLTTKWVDGERLASSASADVPRLAGVALNAYLTMLLDTGTLHCDPHPGNLLRTPDGRLCILDWGMCLDVPTDLQLSLLEFIADLSAENYEEVPNDLVKLEFVPADKLDELRTSGLTVAISTMLKLAAEGGGPKGAMQRMVAQNKKKYAAALAEFDDLDSPEATKVRQRLFREDWQKQMAEDAMARDGDVASGVSGSTTADITMKIEQMQQQNADVFAIPDYFVYMSRAFATLEGIGLSSDSNYSILKECFPYLAKRLLSDDSPRAQGALRTLLYGTGNEIDLSKLQDITSGLESYTVSTSSVESSRGISDEGRDAAAEQLASVVLAEESNYVQELLLRETAVVLDTAVRDAFSLPLAPIRNLLSIPMPPKPFAPLLAPFTLPLELVQATLQLQAVDARDEKSLENIRILTELTSRAGSGAFEGGAASGIAREGAGDALRRLAQAVAARRTALARIGVRFGGSLASVQAERLRQWPGEGASGKPSAGLSDLAGRLAARGADGLEILASALYSLDGDFGALGAGSAPNPVRAARFSNRSAGADATLGKGEMSDGGDRMS